MNDRPTRHALIKVTLAGVLAVTPCVQAQSSEGPGRADSWDTFVELTPESERAIELCLEYLAAKQLPSGAWNSSFGPNAGVTSLALLAFLATGHVPQQGKHADLIDRGLNWILGNVQPSGMIYYTQGASGGPMYEHALSTLLLSELYGMCDRPEIAPAIQAAVRVIINAQNDEGGWRYQPFSRDADISVTVMQVLALRGAQHAGMQVPPETIRRAVAYVKRCQHREGGFAYQAGQGDPGYGRTGAGVTVLEVCGEYDSDEVQRGLAVLLGNIGRKKEQRDIHYALYYAAQAVYQAKDPRRWQEWFPPTRQEIIGMQAADGHFTSPYGTEYPTAMMVLALSIPYRYLPIYQR